MHDADRDLPELGDWSYPLRNVPSAGQYLPRAVTADTAQRQGRSRLGVLQMSEIGDKANYIVALAVLAWLLTDTLGAWL